MQHQHHASEAAANSAIGDLKHVCAFPEALGTGMVMHTERVVDPQLRSRLATMIDDYENVLSRFRPDSLVSTMSKSAHGGSFDFPEYLNPLFEIYDQLFTVTQGGIDPLVGADLAKLGYGPNLSFRAADNVQESVGAVHGRPQWNEAVTRRGSTLVTRGPLQLDFGAVGKGFLVDLLSHEVANYQRHFLIDAGGDLRIECAAPIRIALEDPNNDEEAVGMAGMQRGSLCASAPSRRRWTITHMDQEDGSDRHTSNLMTMHHLINAIDGMPVNEVAATWVCNAAPLAEKAVQQASSANEDDLMNFPTALADGISTALFVCDPQTLIQAFSFECAMVMSDRTALLSQHFPGSFYSR
jgi:thiamine biosynthesis lipoprotein